MITLTSGETRQLANANDGYVIPPIDSIEKVNVSRAFFLKDKSIDDFIESLPQVNELSMKDVKFGCDCGKIHNLCRLPDVLNCRHKLTKERLASLFSLSTHLNLSKLFSLQMKRSMRSSSSSNSFNQSHSRCPMLR